MVIDRDLWYDLKHTGDKMKRNTMKGRITSHLDWRPIAATRFHGPRLYAVSGRGRWDGDAFGNEWPCGYAIHPAPESDRWDLYTDDGEGNGDFLGTFPSPIDAALGANAHDVMPVRPFSAAHPHERPLRTVLTRWGARLIDD